jgi:hypothetical protein
VNAVLEPRSADKGVIAALTRARTLIDGQDFAAAVPLYGEVLGAELQPDLRSEVQTNLAAALCTLVQQKHWPRTEALNQLDRARDLLTAALQHRQRRTAPRDWVSSRANLALVHMARHDITGNEHDILSAHMALDGAEDALGRHGDVELSGWIKAIRDHLLELRDRRTRRR